MYTIKDFKVGQSVMFGRGRGEQTRGTVVKVNRTRLKVRQDEARGSQRSYAIGSVWTVPPSLCRPLGAAPAAPAPRKPKPAPRGSDAATFARVAKREGFDADLMGKTVKVGRSTLTIVGCKPRAPKYPFIGEGPRGGRYKLTAAQVRAGLVGAKPTAKPKRPEAEIMRDIARVYGCLSPENLTWDGERSVAQVGRAGAALLRELRALEAELGRKVSEDEAFRAMGY